jgi:hypothetical protein
VAIPLYSNAAGTIPIVQALMEKGMPMGTTLAFMMAITAISAPEMIILRKVIKPKLIAVFIAMVTLAIMLIGYVFNIIVSCCTGTRAGGLHGGTGTLDESASRPSEQVAVRVRGIRVQPC